ncbi:MAG: cupredoxin domain-containing protein [Actinomycetota bacterium]
MPRGLAAHVAADLTVVAAVLVGASVMPALAAAADQGFAPARVRSAQASSKPTCTDGPAPGARGSEPCDPDAHDRAGQTDAESTPSGPAETPVDQSPVGPPKQKRSARLAQGVVGAAAVDNRFQPMQLTVTIGSRVVWTNEGQNPHTVTADDRAFDSGTLESGQTFAVIFDEIGRVPYYCQVHGEPGSGMFGVVIVRAASGGKRIRRVPRSWSREAWPRRASTLSRSGSRRSDSRSPASSLCGWVEGLNSERRWQAGRGSGNE